MYLRIFIGTVLFALGGHLTLSFIATGQGVGFGDIAAFALWAGFVVVALAPLLVDAIRREGQAATRARVGLTVSALIGLGIALGAYFSQMK